MDYRDIELDRQSDAISRLLRSSSPAPSRHGAPTFERRVMAGLDVRSEKSASKRYISGYGTRFKPIRSGNLGGFVEQFDPRAFDRSLANPRVDDPDICCLFNHDVSLLLGRQRNKTLSVSADALGLHFRCEVSPNNTAGRDMLDYLERGDVSECSIGFYCDEDDWEDYDSTRGLPVRTVLRARLVDIGPVTNPAYNVGTSVAIDPRSLWPNNAGQMPMEIRSHIGGGADIELQRLRRRAAAALRSCF